MSDMDCKRILQMLGDGVISPDEARRLLAELEKPAKPEPQKSADAGSPGPKQQASKQTMEVEMQRADGSRYVVEVPAGLVPSLLKMAGVAVRESARTAAQDAWGGIKSIARNKAADVKDVMKKTRPRRAGSKQPAAPQTGPETDASQARGRVLALVQEGRISPEDASSLLREIEAVYALRKESRAGAVRGV